MKFLLSLGWQLFVIWLALGIGSSLQVIDEVKLSIRDPHICALASAPMTDGLCRFTATAEGNFDGSWTFTPTTPYAAAFRLPAASQKIYDSNDWHMKGGALGPYGLIIAMILLALIPVGIQYRTRRPKRS